PAPVERSRLNVSLPLRQRGRRSRLGVAQPATRLWRMNHHWQAAAGSMGLMNFCRGGPSCFRPSRVASNRSKAQAGFDLIVISWRLIAVPGHSAPNALLRIADERSGADQTRREQWT